MPKLISKLVSIFNEEFVKRSLQGKLYVTGTKMFTELFISICFDREMN